MRLKVSLAGVAWARQRERHCRGLLITSVIDAVSFGKPDVTLTLDMDGIIQSATLSDTLAGESVDRWVGRPWGETVGAVATDRVRRMVEDARFSGVSAFSAVPQRFPSGREVALEYTTVRLGDTALVAIGRNLQAVSELRARLLAAQHAMEQDYWKLREVETRYRLLFDASLEPVLLIAADDLRIVEANPAAIRALGLARGREILPELPAAERTAFGELLQRAREQGKAPGVLMHLGPDATPWMLRASLMAAETGSLFLIQLARAGAAQPEPAPPAASLPAEPATSAEMLVDRLPDGFVVVDQAGRVVRANRAFLDLVEAAAAGAVEGQRLDRWLSQPGADAAVLLANVQRHGVVRLLATTIRGEFGTETEVEISAAGDADVKPKVVGVLVRAVARRLSSPDLMTTDKALSAVLGAVADQVGKISLRQLVQDAVTAVEKNCIEAALSIARGNRTAAAEVLGLSRQSLHSKLNRYSLDGRADPEAARDT